jgi:hypothetical protein
MDKLAYDISDLKSVAGVGRTRAFEDIKAGRLKARKNGRRTLVLALDLNEYLAALPDASGAGNAKVKSA